LLHKEGLAQRFPVDSLTFLDIVVGDFVQWLPRDLGNCLDDIKTADPSLEEDGRFRRLEELLQRRGRE
jgi:hypothetical protein